jgi:hypothetical protein
MCALLVGLPDVVVLGVADWVDAEDLTQPHRGQGGVEAVLEGEAHSQICGQAHRGDYLGSSYLVGRHRLHLPHPANRSCRRPRDAV